MPLPNSQLIFSSREFKGSRLRCLQLTSLSDAKVAKFLNALIHPHAQIDEGANWMPRGMLEPCEPELGRATVFLSSRQRDELISWWLIDRKATARIPNWDIVATCNIENTPGLLLVEAKAHPNELGEKDSTDATGNNRQQIEDALAEAQTGLNELLPGWNLRADSHYQLSNRFAWSWKVARMGVPVVLVYLGFLNATEMLTDSRSLVRTSQEWEDCLLKYSAEIVPSEVWNRSLYVDGTPLVTLIRAAEITVNTSVLS